MDKSENGTLIVKIICLLLSLGLWLYITNVENPLRTYDLKGIPVEITNADSLTDSKFAIINNGEFTVDLKLEGSSSEILNVKKEDFKIVADMSAYALKIGENTVPVQIINAPDNINIKNNGLLAIKVTLEELTQKELTINSKVKINYKENIYEKGQSINPKTVTITGGKSFVDKVNEAVLTGEEKDVDSNKQNEYTIKFIDASGNEVSNIDSNIKTAKLSISVINGKSIPINLKTTGSLPDGYILDSYEFSKTNVIILGDSNVLNNLKSIDTEPIDISSIKSDTQVPVKISLPEGVTLKSGQDDIKVNFKIKKQEIATKTIECNIQVKNLNEEFSMTTENIIGNIVISGPQEELDKITAENINASIDLSNIKSEGSYEYKPVVNLINVSNNVAVSQIDNIKIEVKKNE